MARPSRPSVKFTAFEQPTITSTKNKTNGTYARGQIKLWPKSEEITRFGCRRLKNGTLSCVEYAPCVCNETSATPTSKQVRICSENFARGVRPRFLRRTTLL